MSDDTKPLYPPEALSPKEWLAETCPLCEGSGRLDPSFWPGRSECHHCGGTGRAARHQHDPASAITAPTAEEKRAEELEWELLAICDATGFVNRAEGQDGYERISGQALAQKWRDLNARFEQLSEQLTTARERGRVAEHALTLAKANLQTAEAQRDAARSDLKAYAEDTAVFCAYCGSRKDRPVTLDDLKAHVAECPAHPMAALSEENSRLKQELEKAQLRGEWNERERLAVTRERDSLKDRMELLEGTPRGGLFGVDRSAYSWGEPLSAFRERLASLAHEQWSGWMRYLFEKTTPLATYCPLNDEMRGAEVVMPWSVERWKRQLATPYEALSEEEKESDRKEADRVLALLRGGA